MVRNAKFCTTVFILMILNVDGINHIKKQKIVVPLAPPSPKITEVTTKEQIVPEVLVTVPTNIPTTASTNIPKIVIPLAPASPKITEATTKEQIIPEILVTVPTNTPTTVSTTIPVISEITSEEVPVTTEELPAQLSTPAPEDPTEIPEITSSIIFPTNSDKAVTEPLGTSDSTTEPPSTPSANEESTKQTNISANVNVIPLGGLEKTIEKSSSTIEESKKQITIPIEVDKSIIKVSVPSPGPPENLSGPNNNSSGTNGGTTKEINISISIENPAVAVPNIPIATESPSMQPNFLGSNESLTTINIAINTSNISLPNSPESTPSASEPTNQVTNTPMPSTSELPETSSKEATGIQINIPLGTATEVLQNITNLSNDGIQDVINKTSNWNFPDTSSNYSSNEISSDEDPTTTTDESTIKDNEDNSTETIITRHKTKSRHEENNSYEEEFEYIQEKGSKNINKLFSKNNLPSKPNQNPIDVKFIG